MTPTLFDLNAYTSLATDEAPAPAKRKTRATTRAATRAAKETESAANLQREFELAKTFRDGQLVRKGDRVGMVVDKYLFRDRLSGIWVQWQKEPHDFSPFEKLPLPYLPSALEIISPAPVPNLPRDVPPASSLTSSSQIVSEGMDETLRSSLTSCSKVVSEEKRRSKWGDRCPQVNTYYPGGKGRYNGPYYRITWREHLGKVRHRHIRGGNIYATPARERAERIRNAIARGLSLEEILALC